MAAVTAPLKDGLPFSEWQYGHWSWHRPQVNFRTLRNIWGETSSGYNVDLTSQYCFKFDLDLCEVVITDALVDLDQDV
jgi:hypothetical protein